MSERLVGRYIRALILFIQPLALYKSFSYLLIYLLKATVEITTAGSMKKSTTRVLI